MLVAEVTKLLKLVLVMLANNAVIERERSFSCLKRIKTYLYSATNNRLNLLLILHIQKLSTNRLDLTKVADEFIEEESEKKSKLGL